METTKVIRRFLGARANQEDLLAVSITELGSIIAACSRVLGESYALGVVSVLREQIAQLDDAIRVSTEQLRFVESGKMKFTADVTDEDAARLVAKMRTFLTRLLGLRAYTREVRDGAARSCGAR